jgi:hypothetical protein
LRIAHDEMLRKLMTGCSLNAQLCCLNNTANPVRSQALISGQVCEPRASRMDILLLEPDRSFIQMPTNIS